MAERTRPLVAHIRWSAKDRWYAGYVPGFPDTETTAWSREELLLELGRKLAERIARGERNRARADRPRAGFHRVDLRV